MANSETERYSDLCRLCATKTNMVLAINIFESQAKNRQIYKKIETCLPVRIHEEDELPKMICENCLYKLELLFDFRERSLRTESLLIDLFKELNSMQLEVEQQAMKLAHMDHPDILAQSNNAMLNQHHIQHVNDLDLSQLTHRDNIMVEHEIILAQQSLDHIELSNHELNQELSNHSLQGQENILNNHHRFPDTIEYHQDHHILTEQYALSDINLTDNNLQTQSSIKEDHNLTEENSTNSKEIHQDHLKNDDSSDENRLFIDENILQTNEAHQENFINNEPEWLYCNICNKSFEKSTFHDHDSHFNKCDVCELIFVTKDALKMHRKEVHGNRSADPLKLEKEEKIIPEKEESDCDGNLENDNEEDESLEKVDENTGKKKKWSPKICKECGKSYKTNYKLTEHMRKHTGEQPYKCKSCDKAFRSKIGLAQHEAKHTGQYDYACLTCGKGFQCKSYLMVHQRVHSDVKPYPCTTCGRNFKTKQSLLDHTNRHLGVKPYTCEICGRSFITNGLCKAHQKVHSGTDNRKYSCKVCNKMFVSKSYLQTHLRIHTGEKPFMCEVCGKGFLTRVDLKIHSTMHTGEKSYVCEMCGKAFARRDALRCHRRSHTGERPYSCDICGQTFTQFSPMAIHKRLHTGERPYQCDVCGKKFVSRSTMMVHSKKHTR